MSIFWELLDKAVAGAAGGAVSYGVFLWNRRRDRKALVDGELLGELLIVSNVIEDEVRGEKTVPVLKPRTLRRERPLTDYFPAELARDIVKAAQRGTEDSPESQFIMLPDESLHARFMKRVVNIASELGVEGHTLRMMGLPTKKNEVFCCITYSHGGSGDWIIRIDLIAKAALRRFVSEEDFLSKLSYLAEEGSHLDNARIFQVCARKLFCGPYEGRTLDSRSYVRRVALPTAP